MTSELLLELFSEEIPALMQKDAEKSYKAIFTKILEENEIFAKVQLFVGPRRITIYISHLPKFTLPKAIKIKGPKVNAQTLAIEGFCRSNNIIKDQLSTLSIQDQLYYIYIKKTEATDIRELLKYVLPKAISSYVWPKSMYWGSYNISWVRPLKNILCIFNGEILPLKFGHLTTNNITYGHRFMAYTNNYLANNLFSHTDSHPESIAKPLDIQIQKQVRRDSKHDSKFEHFQSQTIYREIKIQDFADYQDKLTKNYVIIDRQERQRLIKEQLLRIANLHNLSIKEDERLLEEVAGLVEFPVVMIGKIAEKFLTLPSEVLITSMKTHQKYFSSFDNNGKFAPYFFFVSNMISDQNIIVAGNEQVLSARLSDALYFYQQDLAKSLQSRLPQLEQIIFHTKLGNFKEKTERMVAICNYLMKQNESLQIAAKLCKSDLTSEMVGEFSELQGIMGYYYAINEGLEEDVALAIRDHYKPQGASDNVPQGDAAKLALADKIDSLVGLILIGEAPNGSKDPYSLRRQAVAIIRIILNNQLDLDIKELVFFAVKLYNFSHLELVVEFNNRSRNKNGVLGEKNKTICKLNKPIEESKIQLIQSFLEERAKFHFKNQYDLSLINAVLDFNIEGSLVTIEMKLVTLQRFLVSTEGKDLLMSYKRVSNILDNDILSGEINQNDFTSCYEQELFTTLTIISTQINNNIADKNFMAALNLLQKLLIPIANFFDNIMVKCEDPQIANNRLLLLQMVKQLFYKIAKFDSL